MEKYSAKKYKPDSKLPLDGHQHSLLLASKQAADRWR